MKLIQRNPAIVFFLGMVVVVTIIFAELSLFNKPDKALGSVADFNAYFSTTTQTISLSPVLLTGTSTNRNGRSGTFGSFIVSDARSIANGTLTLYDATTSDATLRANTMGTSSILVGELQFRVGSSTQGTFQYDSLFKNGLIMTTTGTVPTTTVTWRED